MALGRANLGAQNEEDGQRGGNQKREKMESSWAWLYKYIYLEKIKLFRWKTTYFLPPKLRLSENASRAAKLRSSPSIG